MTNYTHVTLPYGELPKDVINLGTMLGPFFLGHCFNWALFGILCLQIYIYYLRFPNDHKWIKTLAYGTFTLDTFFIICMTHAGWRVLVAYWGDVNIFHELTWTWALLPFSSGFVSMIVQLFFVYRIYRLSHSFAMPFIITMVTVTQCAFAIRTSVIAHNVRSFRYIRDFLPAFWLGGSILADILISSTIVRILWKSKTGFKDTDSVVARLMRLSIEAAAVPTISATIKLVFIYTRHDNVHLIICMLLPRLYSNTMMGMLNGRDQLFGGGSKPDTMAGASRLVDPDTGSGFLHSIRSKIAFVTGFNGGNSGSSSGTRTQVDTRLSKGDLETMGAYGEKIFIQKSITSTQYHDVDLENARRSASLHHYDSTSRNPRRGSNCTIESIDRMTDDDVLNEMPTVPGGASLLKVPVSAMHRPKSTTIVTPMQTGFGVYESRSDEENRKFAPGQEHKSQASYESNIYPGR